MSKYWKVFISDTVLEHAFISMSTSQGLIWTLPNINGSLKGLNFIVSSSNAQWFMILENHIYYYIRNVDRSQHIDNISTNIVGYIMSDSSKSDICDACRLGNM